MMYTNNNNNFFAFVCRNQAVAEKADGTLIDAAGDLTDGEVVLVNRHNEALNPAAAISGTTQFKIVTRAGGRLYSSPIINFADCTITSGLAANQVQQVTNIGGTTAGTGGYLLPNVASDDTLAAAEVGNSFYVLIEKQDNDEANRMGYAPAITAQVKLKDTSGDSGFTFTNAEEIQVNLGAQLREAIAKNDALEVDGPSTAGSKYVRAKVVANVATQANITGGANNATLTFGSKTVTTSANCVAGIVAADYLNVAGDLYKLASDPGTGTTITLEDPYRGPSETLVTGTGAAQVGFSTQAQVQAATHIGVQLEGQAQHNFDVARDRIYSASRFNVRFAKDGENVGATITRTTAADEGLGEFEQVASQEYQSFGQLGQRWVSDIPGQTREQNARDSRVYGLIAIREITTKNNALIGSNVGKNTYHIWMELSSAVAASGTLETSADTQDALLTQLGVTASTVAASGQA